MKIEKFDYLLPNELLIKNYENMYLDFESVVQWLKSALSVKIDLKRIEIGN